MADQIEGLKNGGSENDEPNLKAGNEEQIIRMHLRTFQPCNLVHHFPGPAFSRSCIFQQYGPSFFLTVQSRPVIAPVG